MYQGKLREYLAFHEGNPGVLESYGLDHEQCIAHMRLLSMCSLATEHEEIPYEVHTHNQIIGSLIDPLTH